MHARSNAISLIARVSAIEGLRKEERKEKKKGRADGDQGGEGEALLLYDKVIEGWYY